MIFSDESDSDTAIDDLEQIDSASCQLSALAVAAMIQILQHKRRVIAYSKHLGNCNGCKGQNKMGAHRIFFRIEGQATSSERANRKRNLTRYENRMLDGPLSAFELHVDNLMLTHVQ